VNFLPLIKSKHEGKILAPAQIQEFIREFTAGIFARQAIRFRFSRHGNFPPLLAAKMK